MKLSILSFVTIFTLTFITCQNNTKIKQKEKELELKEKELYLKQKELNGKQNSGTSNNPPQTSDYAVPKVGAFVYVVFKVKQPKLEKFDETSSTKDDFSFLNPPLDLSYVNFEDNIYKSEIKEVSILDFDEDKQYQFMDMIEEEIKFKLSNSDRGFKTQVILRVRDEEKKERYMNYSSKIVDRKIKKFITYKEASIQRFNNNEEF